MIEILVVIGIIALLISIAVPAAHHALENQRKNSTMANLHVIENAIDAYRRSQGNLPPDFFSIKDVLPGPKEWFNDNNPTNSRWDGEVNEPVQDDDGDLIFSGNNIRETIPGVSLNITFKPIWRFPANQGDDYASTQYKATQDYKSIETLYLYITQLCPEGKELLGRLPHEVITNNDLCSGSPCKDLLVFDTNADNVNSQPYNEPGKDKAVDLFEIRDAWRVPLTYQSFRLGVGNTARWIWELRSFGSDGKADGNILTAEDQNGDDVVLRGQ